MQKLYFLAIDDASFIRDLIKRTLRGVFDNAQIDEATNGKRAQSLIAKNQYDLILCDWEMPEMSGIEVLEWMRNFESEEGMDKTPFIMVTSRGDKEHVVEAVNAGVSDYIGKPFSNNQLIKKVLKCLSKNHNELVSAIVKGKAGKLAPKEQTGPKGLFKDSSDILTGAAQSKVESLKPSAKNVNEVKGGAGLLTSNSVSEKLLTTQNTSRQRVKSGNKGKCQLRVSSGKSKGDIKDINLTEILIESSREEGFLPQLFEQAVVDIAMPGQATEAAQINGFVIAVMAADKSQDSEKIITQVKYVDDDPSKMEVLSKFIAEVR